jgi:hypothetical protein
VQRTGQQAVIAVDALLPDGTFLNSAQARLKVSSPDLQQQDLDLVQTAPGRYEARLQLDTPGIWNLEAAVTESNQPPLRISRPLYAGRSDELRLRPVNQELLQQLATISGGVANPEPADVFNASSRQTRRSIPLRTWLLSAAAILLLLDIALRRIELQPRRLAAGQPPGTSTGVASP